MSVEDLKNANLFTYKAEVVRWVDGDTVYLKVDLGFRMSMTDSFRLIGINTPEIRGTERPQGLVVKEFVIDLLPKGSKVLIETRKSGKYGRWLAEIYFLVNDEYTSLNNTLLVEGLAKPYK